MGVRVIGAVYLVSCNMPDRLSGTEALFGVIQGVMVATAQFSGLRVPLQWLARRALGVWFLDRGVRFSQPWVVQVSPYAQIDRYGKERGRLLPQDY